MMAFSGGSSKTELPSFSLLPGYFNLVQKVLFLMLTYSNVLVYS